MKAGEKRMSTDRCAHLCAVAIANKLDEVWISLQPILAGLYVAQYLPVFYRGYGLFLFLTHMNNKQM